MTDSVIWVYIKSLLHCANGNPADFPIFVSARNKYGSFWLTCDNDIMIMMRILLCWGCFVHATSWCYIWDYRRLIYCLWLLLRLWLNLPFLNCLIIPAVVFQTLDTHYWKVFPVYFIFHTNFFYFKLKF